MIRYFRSAVAVYQGVCDALDAAYGYPRPETLTDRTLPLVGSLPTDETGRVYLAVSAEYCEFNLPSELLPQLLASGQVEEITAEEYGAVLPQGAD
ncbi:MAG: hypothetical protein EBR82_41285 [Caulobacteraceae bacterium]|nr:hypothetical protein [Caulobacteraceae bacterium]